MPVTATAVQQAIQTVEKRLNNLGTADLLIVAQGSDRILVQMPGVTPEEASDVREILEKIAKLELKAVHPESRALANRLAAENEADRVLTSRLQTLRAQKMRMRMAKIITGKHPAQTTLSIGRILHRPRPRTLWSLRRQTHRRAQP